MNISTNLRYRGIARLLPLLFSLTILGVYGQQKSTPKDSIKGKPLSALAAATVASTNSMYSPKIIPASPEAASLGKYVDIPVNNYTGTPSISIPLYTIKTRDLAVPISISYHGSGIRVEEEASCVGLGWALNSGGVIQHVVRGKDDFLENVNGTSWTTLNQATSDANIAARTAICYYFQNPNAAYFLANTTTVGNSLEATLQAMIAATGFERPDIERDIFAFNFLGMSGKFMIEPLGGGQYKINQLSQSDLKIELLGGDVTGNSGFVITGIDGTKYTFGQVEKQQHRTGDPLITGKTTDPNYSGNVNGWTYKTPFVSAWYLTKVESQRGDVINWTYTVTPSWVSALPGRSESYITNVTGATGGASADPALFRWNITEVQTKQVYPNTITFDNGSVQFTGATRNDLQIGAMRLASMAIVSSTGTALKTIQFNQDYFSSGTSGPGYISKRLKLLSVQESNGNTCLPPHSFTYEESIALPNKDSYMQDYWGYYNAQVGNDTKGTMLPPFAITGTTSSSIYKLPTSVQGGADRTVNPTAMRAGVLTKITYPTGATAEFDFQPHTFANIATSDRPYFVATNNTYGFTKTGGGLRINKITAKDQSNVSEVTNYDYRYSYTSQGTTSGRLMANLQFSDFVVVSGTGVPEMAFSSSPRSPMGSGAQGNPVGYSQVTVYKGSTPAEAGYSVYQYENTVDEAAANFCINNTIQTIDVSTTCSTQPILNNYAQNCDPYTSLQFNYYNGVTDASLPNYVYTLNGSLKREEHWKGGATSLLIKTVENAYEAVNRVRVKNFKVLQRNSIVSCLIYYTDSEWIRPTSTIVNEYGAGGDISSTAKVTTTTVYGYNSAGLHKQTASITTTNSKGEQFETLSAYAQDSTSGSDWLTDLKARNMVVRLRETRNKINPDQSRTTTHITRTNYAKWFNSFMAPKTIESKIGTGPFVQDIAFAYAQGDSYSSPGDVLSTTELNGIQTNYQYYIGSGKKYLALNSTVPAGTSLARTTTYDYEPLRGVSRITDPNNLQTTYTYDPLGRLTTIKDPDQNVVKTYHYNYATAGCNTANTLISPNFKNIVVVGNSITQLQAQSGNDGWQSTALLTNTNADGSKGWGRAASIKANDFAHILESRFQQLNATAKLLPLWEAPWEYDYVNGRVGWPYYNYTTLKTKITNFFGTTGPDLVIIRLGENVNNATVEPNNFKANYNTLIDQVLSVSSPGAKVILTNSMWPDQPLANARIKEVAAERSLPFVDLSDMYANPVYLGGNDPATLLKFPTDGGDRHPGDVGMLEIADRIWGKLFNETKQVTIVQSGCSSLIGSVISPAMNTTVTGTVSTTNSSLVTCALAVSVCAPVGQVITSVEIRAQIYDGNFDNNMGFAVADVSRPGVYTLSAAEGNVPGKWPTARLAASSNPYRFYAIITTNVSSFTTAYNLVTLTNPSGTTGCSSLVASVLSPANNASIAGTPSSSPTGYLTCPLAVTTCAPQGTTITNVAIWATLPDGTFPFFKGNALPDPSRPGVFTLSASQGTTNGLWTGGTLYAGSYRFYAIVTTSNNQTLTTGTNLVTLTTPTVNNVATYAVIQTRPYSGAYQTTIMGRYSGGQFYGTNDLASTGTLLGTFPPGSSTLTPGSSVTIAFTNNTYRYIRYLPSSSSYGELAELGFYGNSGKLNGAKLGSSNTYDYPNTPPATYTYTNAFDGDPNTIWNGAAAGPANNWVAIDLGSTGCITPTAPVITTSAVLLCPSQQATLTAAGCSGTVTWSSGQTGLSVSVSPTSTTTYTATCTVNGCTSSASNQVTISIPTVMPSTWTVGTVGIPSAPGCANRAQSGSITVRGVGNVPGTSADAFPYVYKTLSGDVTIIAKVAGMPMLTPLGDGPRAGIIFRNSTATDASFVWLVQEANGVIGNYRRAVNGGTASFGPSYVQGMVGGQLGQAWIKLVKVGNTIISYYSTNANPEAINAWTLLNTHTDVLFASSFLVGFTAFNYNYGVTGAANNTTVTEAVFTNVTVNGVSF